MRRPSRDRASEQCGVAPAHDLSIKRIAGSACARGGSRARVRVTQELPAGRGERRAVTGRDGDAGACAPQDLAYVAYVAGDQGKADGQRLSDRHRHRLGQRRQHREVGETEERRDVIARAEQVHPWLRGAFGLERGTILTVTEQEHMDFETIRAQLAHRGERLTLVLQPREARYVDKHECAGADPECGTPTVRRLEIPRRGPKRGNGHPIRNQCDLARGDPLRAQHRQLRAGACHGRVGERVEQAVVQRNPARPGLPGKRRLERPIDRVLDHEHRPAGENRGDASPERGIPAAADDDLGLPGMPGDSSHCPHSRARRGRAEPREARPCALESFAVDRRRVTDAQQRDVVGKRSETGGEMRDLALGTGWAEGLGHQQNPQRRAHGGTVAEPSGAAGVMSCAD